MSVSGAGPASYSLTPGRQSGPGLREVLGGERKSVLRGADEFPVRVRIDANPHQVLGAAGLALGGRDRPVSRQLVQMLCEVVLQDLACQGRSLDAPTSGQLIERVELSLRHPQVQGR